MSWFQEGIDFIMKMKPMSTVEEYQTGLYWWWGHVVERRIPERKLIERIERKKSSKRISRVKLDDKLKPLGIDEIRKLEDTVNAEYRSTKNIPTGWHIYHGGWKRLWLGKCIGKKKLEHPERYSKNIPYGVYLHIPEIFDVMRVVTMPAREVVKDLGYVNILMKARMDTYLKSDNTYANVKLVGTGTDKSSGSPVKYRIVQVTVRPFVRYEIEDGYKAFTNVQDWQNTYHSQALVRTAEQLRGGWLEDLLDSKEVEKFTSAAEDSLNNISARGDWGIWTSQIGFADTGPGQITKNVQELSTTVEGFKIDLPEKYC